MLRTLFSATILAGALAGSVMAQTPDAGCALPSEPTPRTGALVECLRCTDCLVFFDAELILLRRPREWDTKQREARQAKQE